MLCFPALFLVELGYQDQEGGAERSNLYFMAVKEGFGSPVLLDLGWCHFPAAGCLCLVKSREHGSGPHAD